MIAVPREVINSAPRHRIARHFVITETFAKNFKEKYPEYSKMTINDMNHTIAKFHDTLAHEIINHRDGVELPQYTGLLKIIKYTGNKKSKEIADRRYQTPLAAKNLKTDGRIIKMLYTNFNPRYNFKNKEFWAFFPHQNVKTAVSTLCPDKSMMYVDQTGQISPLRKDKLVKVLDFKIMQPYNIEKYNDLEI